jgi:hypothetical protein
MFESYHPGAALQPFGFPAPSLNCKDLDEDGKEEIPKILPVLRVIILTNSLVSN